MEILERNEYHTDDPYVKEIINEAIDRQMAMNIIQGDNEASKGKRGKSAHDQAMWNLKNNDGKFKHLIQETDNLADIDYEQDENKRRREKDMQLVQPPRFKIIGYTVDKNSALKKRPIARISDLYLTSSSKIRRLMKVVFERQIYPQRDRKAEGDVMISKSTSNANELEQIIKKYEEQEEDYNFENRQVQLDQKQLEEYVIDRGQSKRDYFLFYKNEEPKPISYQVVNNPLKSQNFLKQLHADVRKTQRRHEKVQQFEEQQGQKKEQRKQGDGKVKQYFGQFKPISRQRAGAKFIMEDTFESKLRVCQTTANSIINYLSFVDNQVVEQRYLLGLPENDKLELNLENPFLFQPKLHTILNRERQFFQEGQYKARLAEANKGNRLDVSLLSGYSGKGKSKAFSGGPSEQPDRHGQRQDQHQTIQRVIEREIMNVYKQPLKHSDVATRYQFVKFTLQEDCFNNYHRFNFPFHEHLTGRTKIEIIPHKNRKAKPNGLVINSEMRESNDKFARKEDLSLVRGQYIMIEYIQENPLIMSDVGMCERMILQVNYQQVLQRVKSEALHDKSFQEMEEERDIRRNARTMTFERHCEIWRRCIKQIFGEYGKQYFWDPAKSNGKLIGIPQGPGVGLMESNLCNVPIVRKTPKSRQFLLVREGKRWVIRRIENLYVSGQIEPHLKVICPNSRAHNDFKMVYEKAFVVKQVRDYGSVNFDQVKMAFKGQSQNHLRKVLKNANMVSKDSKLYRSAGEEVRMKQNELTPEDIVLFERMQRSICQLRQVGIIEIKTNEKMKNVLKQFNRRHFENPQKIAIARMIREQLQLTSWYLTQSLHKYNAHISKIEINGFADPTNGRGGYSYINKPQKERTSKEDMEDRAEKQKSATMQDLRKLKVDDSKERLRQMGHNQIQMQAKGRWQLISMLKGKEGTQFSRRERQTKGKKIENQKKQLNRNFNRLLAYLHDQTEEPAFDYGRQKRNKIEDYIQRQREYFNKINRKYGRPQQLGQNKDDNRSEDSDNDQSD